MSTPPTSEDAPGSAGYVRQWVNRSRETHHKVAWLGFICEAVLAGLVAVAGLGVTVLLSVALATGTLGRYLGQAELQHRLNDDFGMGEALVIGLAFGLTLAVTAGGFTLAVLYLRCAQGIKRMLPERRSLILICCVLRIVLSYMPLGTLLALYTLYVLYPKGSLDPQEHPDLETPDTA